MIKKGELVMSCAPFVHVVSSEERGKLCDFCMTAKSEETKVRACSGCKVAYYCCKVCQINHWKKHKLECSKLKQFSNNVPKDSARIMALLILKSRTEAGDNKELPYIKLHTGIVQFKRSFEDFEDHYDEIKSDVKRMEHFTSMVATLKTFLGGDLLPSMRDLLKIFGKMCINSFSICRGDLEPVGVGVYLGASVIDHSCVPNSVATFDGNQLTIRAIRNIESDNISDIRISYTDLLATTDQRQQDLVSSYYFLCNCAGCLNTSRDSMMRSVKCPSGNCESVIFSDNDDNCLEIKCSSCGNLTAAETVDSLLNRLKSESKELTQKLKECKIKGVDDKLALIACEEFLTKYRKKVPQVNIFMVQVIKDAIDACLSHERYEDSLKYGLMLLPAYRQYYDDCHPSLALHLMALGKLQLNFLLAPLEETLKFLVEAIDMLSVTHGSGHSLISEAKELQDECEEKMRMILKFAHK